MKAFITSRANPHIGEVLRLRLGMLFASILIFLSAPLRMTELLYQARIAGDLLRFARPDNELSGPPNQPRCTTDNSF